MPMGVSVERIRALKPVSGHVNHQLAEIAIPGDGDGDFGKRVTDENGNTICLDRSYSDNLYCPVTPAWGKNFHVVVDNAGRIRNSYYILTNQARALGGAGRRRLLSCTGSASIAKSNRAGQGLKWSIRAKPDMIGTDHELPLICP